MACGFTFCSNLPCRCTTEYQPAGRATRDLSARTQTRDVHRGGMRRAPSRRMTSPLSIVFSTMWSGERGVLVGAAEARRERDLAPSAVRASSGRPASSGVSNRPGRDRADADAGLGEVARGRERHADDAALGRGVGDLADLAVVGGDRGGGDAARRARPRRRASLASIAAAARRRTLKLPIRLTRMTVSNGSKAVRAACGRRSSRPSRCRRSRRRCAGRRRPPRRRPRPRPASASVTSAATKRAPSSSASACAALGVEVGDRDVGAGGVQRAGRRGAEAGRPARDECVHSLDFHARGR